jgi:hypothetical protein
VLTVQVCSPSRNKKGSGSIHETMRFRLEVLHGEVRTCRVPTDMIRSHEFARLIRLHEAVDSEVVKARRPELVSFG